MISKPRGKEKKILKCSHENGKRKMMLVVSISHSSGKDSWSMEARLYGMNFAKSWMLDRTLGKGPMQAKWAEESLTKFVKSWSLM